eukprot:Seg1263.6 transcript_id=Seg1263.6/GoldUCD/mRNA.D3Y31 product="AN1-type zinc finger protein 2B" protein_id=Seg1263.6/GoldUCD/D3Y31
MANSQEIDLMSIGKHCSKNDCRQLDYLPFKCDYCSKEFCKEHHDVKEHSCPSFVNRDRIVPTCPLCGKLVALTLNETINDQVERHIRSGCQKLVVEKRKKNQCSQMNCRQRTLIPFNCHSCYKNFCVRHRHSGDHTCIPMTPTSIAVH